MLFRGIGSAYCAIEFFLTLKLYVEQIGNVCEKTLPIILILIKDEFTSQVSSKCM